MSISDIAPDSTICTEGSQEAADHGGQDRGPASEARDTAIGDLLIIEPPKGWIGIDWAEVWRYRELLYFLTWRDVKVRYKQTALGAAWAIIQPFFTMLVFTLFFGRLAKVPSDGIPYP